MFWCQTGFSGAPPLDATIAYTPSCSTRINGTLRSLPDFAPRMVTRTTGRPLMSTLSVVPVSKIFSVCSRTQLAGLSSYSPVKGMTTTNARRRGSIASMDTATDTATLRRALTAALKARDAVAVSALRSALAAVENAGAVDAAQAPSPVSGPIAGAVSGLGAGEVERRPVDVRAVVAAEVEHRRSAAREYAELGRTDRAERLRAEAEVLAAHLRS